MLDDISASVDFHFDAPTKPQPASSSSSNTGFSDSEIPGETWHGRALRGYVLLFPMWAALEEAKQQPQLSVPGFGGVKIEETGLHGNIRRGSLKIVSEGDIIGPEGIGFDVKARCDWVRRVLEYIHGTLGIAQAGAIGSWGLAPGGLP